MKVMKTTLAATALCLSVTGAWAAGLTAHVNTNQVAQGDSLKLVLTTQGPATSAPDLGPLARDFEVLGASQSSQTQIINDQRSQSISWIVTLSPQTTGAITIPSLSAGALSSDPLTVQVVDASQLPKLQGTVGIALSATIDDGQHYQFQEIPLTVRIETAQTLQSAQLIVPTGDFELTQTGQDRQSQITRAGQSIAVVERDYLLRPQSTGELTIPPFTLKGAVNDPNQRRSPPASPFGSSFGGRDPFAMMDQMMARMGGMGGMGSPFGSMRNTGQPFAARSDAITFDVLANPNAGSADWFLPAKAVEMRSEWMPETPTFRDGEAVTRKISILALGARPEQLPDLRFDEPTGARIYVDDIATDMVETAEGTVARRDFSLSIVPTQGGVVTLPEIKVDWLDTASGETNTATLPAQTVSVEATGSIAPVAQAPAQSLQNSGEQVAPDVTTDPIRLFAVMGGGFFLILGPVLFMLNRKVFDKKPDVRSVSSQPTTLRDLCKAAANGDRDRFYAKLLELRAQPHGFAPLRIEDAIGVLEGARYAPAGEAGAVDLSGLLKTLTKGAIRQSARLGWARGDTLPALYPQAG